LSCEKAIEMLKALGHPARLKIAAGPLKDESNVARVQKVLGLLTRCATPYICCGNVMVEPFYKDDSIFTGR